MDLQALLKKTEDRSAKIKTTRTAPSVAMEERPYTNDLGTSPTNDTHACAPTQPPVGSKVTVTAQIETHLFGGTESESTIPTTADSGSSPSPTNFQPQKLRTQPRTKLGHTSDKPRTKLGHTSDKPRTSDLPESVVQNETSDKLRSQPRTELRTDLGQSSDKLRTNGGFLELTGLRREILLFLHEQTKLARDRVTDPIAISVLATSCETTVLSAQKTIQRLEDKGLLQRVSYRNGRGGWTRYEVSHEVFQEILHLESQDKVRTNLGQSSDKLRSQPRTQPRTSLPSSSSVLDLENLNTTTTTPDNFTLDSTRLSPEWEQIDPSPLSGVGFTRSHLVQVARLGKLTAHEVSDSIQFFAFDLKHNGKDKDLKGPPLNFFMGILRKGLPYTPPENYERPEAEARRKYLEGKRRIEERRQAEESELQDLEFLEWRRALRSEEANAVVPEIVRNVPQAREHTLRQHFEQNVWPSLRLSIPSVGDENVTLISR